MSFFHFHMICATSDRIESNPVSISMNDSERLMDFKRKRANVLKRVGKKFQRNETKQAKLIKNAVSFLVKSTVNR